MPYPPGRAWPRTSRKLNRASGRSKSTLVIAKLDRLARNVAFVSALMEAGVDFVAVDNATANKLTIHILAAVAEDEARRISERTKAALGAAKARGQLLGSARPDHWKGRENERLAGLVKAREQANIVNRAKALAGVADLLPDMQKRRQAGETLANIANALNAEGQRTTRGAEWSAMQVKRAIDRANAN
jgi:DNA invertase Pin-like site-specific DNA recombinase